mgnify:FL=1
MRAFCKQVVLNVNSGKVIILVFSVFASNVVTGNEELLAPLVELNKIYQLPDPFGKTRVAYVSPGGERDSLLIETNLFSSSLSGETIEALQGPIWEELSVGFFSVGSGIEISPLENVFYIQVPMTGRAGEKLDNIWVTFHFDKNGYLDRKLKRIVSTGTTGFSRLYWEEWEVGSEISLDLMLEAGDRN